jgi:hypothetical protein
MSDPKFVKNKLNIDFSFKEMDSKVLESIIELEEKLINKVLNEYFGKYCKAYDKKVIPGSFNSFILTVNGLEIGVINHVYDGQNYKVDFNPNSLESIENQSRKLIAKKIDSDFQKMNEQYIKSLTAQPSSTPIGLFNHLEQTDKTSANK